MRQRIVLFVLPLDGLRSQPREPQGGGGHQNLKTLFKYFVHAPSAVLYSWRIFT